MPPKKKNKKTEPAKKPAPAPKKPAAATKKKSAPAFATRKNSAPAPAPAPKRKINLKKTDPAPKPADRLASPGLVAAATKNGIAHDLRPDAPAPQPGNIPWSYGDVRITAMARDPQWAYAYWEITDAALQAAREKLHSPDATLHLRVYDTTHRDFDGLNAHTHWDIAIDRAQTGATIRIGKPGSTVHIDVGLRAPHGDFAPIARSGAVEMPRDSVSPHTQSQWSTVLRSGPGYNYHHRYTAPPPQPGGSPPPPEAAAAPSEFERVFQHLAGEGWARTEWSETLMDGRVVRWIKWSGPFTVDQFAALPVSTEPYQTVEVLLQGERRVMKFEGGDRFVYGPWKIVMEAVGPRGERRTIHQWAVRHRWTTEQGHVKIETPAILTRILGGRRVTAAASGSESRLAQEAWGSEIWIAGASELRWLGASESLAMGSSETVQSGASESLYLGASQIAERGASEHRWGGASELYTLGGASEERP